VLRVTGSAAPVKFHTLRREQQIPRSRDEVFAFFSDARNLEAVTGPWLRFRTLTPGPIGIAAGAQIRYQLKVRGVPVGWNAPLVKSTSRPGTDCWNPEGGSTRLPAKWTSNVSRCGGGVTPERTTLIRRWDPPAQFVDVQLSGPYRLWHHTHRFEAHHGGTRMIDVVRYRLPFGPFGRLVNALLMRREVERIFDYRNRRIAEIFR
jgi:hypothetical protein